MIAFFLKSNPFYLNLYSKEIMSPYKILLITFLLNSGFLFSQNKIDFARPAEASLIEDKITEWIDLLFPETYYFFKKDSSSEDYRNWNGLYIGETFNQCIPSGPDDEIYVNCDTAYYFRENNESYALLVFRHSENGQSGFQHSTWMKEEIHIEMSQQISLVLLKFVDKKWKIEEKIEDNKFLSSDDIIFIPVRSCEFISPKIIIYGRNDILIEVNNNTGFGGQFSLTSSIGNKTLVYHLSYPEPILNTYSEAFHLTPFTPSTTFYNKKDSNNYAYSNIEPVYTFDGDKPMISLKLTTKKSNAKLDEQFNNDNLINETDLIILSEFEKELAELEKRKSEIEKKYLLADLKKEIEKKYLLADLKKEIENVSTYYPKKYNTITEKEAYNLIAGKSLSYYYYSADYLSNAEEQLNRNKNIPYVNHIFLENGEYYKITNVLKFDEVHVAIGNRYCSFFFPAILKKGKWKISENKIQLELEDYNFDKFNSLQSTEEIGYNDEDYNMYYGINTKTSNDIKNLRTGWPFTNYIEIDKLSDLNTLLYEIAETECNYGYRIGNRFNEAHKNAGSTTESDNHSNEKKKKISADIAINSEPFGASLLGQELSYIKKLNEGKLNDDDAFQYEIIGNRDLLKIRNEKFLNIYANLKDFKKFEDSEKFEAAKKIETEPSRKYRKNEKKEEAPKK